MFGGQRPVALADRGEIVGRLHAQNAIGVAVLMNVPLGDRLEPLVRDTEELGDPGEKRELLFVHQAISFGDMEQRVDDIFEHRAELIAGPAHAGEILGIGLEAGDVLAGEIVKPRDVAGLFRRKFEDLPKRFNLGIRDDTVGLGHLRRKRNDGHREGNAPPGFRIAFEHRADRLNDAADHVAGGVTDCAEQPVPERRYLFAGEIEDHAESLTKYTQKKQGVGANTED